VPRLRMRSLQTGYLPARRVRYVCECDDKQRNGADASPTFHSERGLRGEGMVRHGSVRASFLACLAAALTSKSGLALSRTLSDADMPTSRQIAPARQLR
jgi:hypothetical protein